MSGSGALTAVQIALGAANEAIPEEMAAGPIGWALAAATGIADAAAAAMTIYNATNQSKAALKAKPADKATTTCSGGGDDDPNKPKKTRKPQQPNKKKWIARGGTVSENSDGSTTFTNKNGTSVTYNKEGYPDFSPHSDFTFDSDNLTGNRRLDNVEADKIYRAETGEDRPDGYTWHHVEDGKTMELVPSDLHAEFSHTGGASMLNMSK